ncbi:MAG: S1C family serine protease [Patescibacteria group bacterium]|jgi:serine protease Do|nr:S1C family serine protease [Patescibacteria group bacterium]
MGKEKQRIVVVDEIDKKETVDVKKSMRDEIKKERQEELKDGVQKFYNDQSFNNFQKPLTTPRGWVWLAVILAIIFGLASGIGGSLFLLTRQTIKIPFLQEISLTKYFPTHEVTLVTEKKVTVTSDARAAALVNDLSLKMVRIFSAKEASSKAKLSFLDQIYAPWQVKSLGLIITSDGWLASGGDFDAKQKYVAVDAENKVYPVEEILEDSVTGISFIKITAQNLGVVKFALAEEVKAGEQVIVWDKFNKINFTEISNPRFKNINKTDDLVHSTDKFDDYILLDSQISPSLFPGGVIFGLDGAEVGLISQEKIIPSWQFKTLIDQVLKDKKIKRPYLGVDYLRIEEAPGISSSLFKDLTNGAIVFGSPVISSPAQKAGLNNADIIVKVDGISLNKDQDLTYLIQQKNPGDTVELTVLRAGEEKVIKATVSQQP